jgi:hypothetical protein
LGEVAAVAWILYLGGGLIIVMVAVRRARDEARTSAFAWAALLTGILYLVSWLIGLRLRPQFLVSVLLYGVLLGPAFLLASAVAWIVALARKETPSRTTAIPAGLSILLITFLVFMMVLLQRAL